MGRGGGRKNWSLIFLQKALADLFVKVKIIDVLKVVFAYVVHDFCNVLLSLNKFYRGNSIVSVFFWSLFRRLKSLLKRVLIDQFPHRNCINIKCMNVNHNASSIGNTSVGPTHTRFNACVKTCVCRTYACISDAWSIVIDIHTFYIDAITMRKLIN